MLYLVVARLGQDVCWIDDLPDLCQVRLYLDENDLEPLDVIRPIEVVRLPALQRASQAHLHHLLATLSSPAVTPASAAFTIFCDADPLAVSPAFMELMAQWPHWGVVQPLVHPQLGPMAEDDSQMLRWAAALHETGISISYAGYHKHSCYILSQADMPGFSQGEQLRLARLVLAHRGKLGKAELEDLPSDSPDWALIFALRMAALLCRRRSDLELPPMDWGMEDSGFRIGQIGRAHV